MLERARVFQRALKSLSFIRHLSSGELTQGLYDLSRIVFLEQADGGDSGGACFQTLLCILHRHTTQGQNWNFCPAGFAQLG